jgi:acylphosphatase
MRAAYIVHGFVQGVGYRAYVKGVADRLKLGGIITNRDDGSVLIIVEGEETVLKEFEEGINISIKYGTQVQNIERRYDVDENPDFDIDFSTFQIVHGE